MSATPCSPISIAAGSWSANPLTGVVLSRATFIRRRLRQIYCGAPAGARESALFSAVDNAQFVSERGPRTWLDFPNPIRHGKLNHVVSASAGQRISIAPIAPVDPSRAPMRPHLKAMMMLENESHEGARIVIFPHFFAEFTQSRRGNLNETSDPPPERSLSSFQKRSMPLRGQIISRFLRNLIRRYCEWPLNQL